MRVLIVTGERSATPLLRAVAATDELTVCAPDPRDDALCIARIAEAAGLPRWPTRALREPGAGDRLRDAGIEVLVSFRSRSILPEAVLAAPTRGSFNLHTGPLPAYAGLNAPSWAIFNGEREHGVTLHWMDAGIDTGAVVAIDRFPIEPDDTGILLSGRCASRGRDLILRLLDSIRRGETPARDIQDATQRRYLGRGVPNDGRIDWSWPARKLAAFVRAANFYPYASPWGTSRATVNGVMLELLRAESLPWVDGFPPGALIALTDQYVDIATGVGGLRITEVMIDGDREPPSAALR